MTASQAEVQAGAFHARPPVAATMATPADQQDADKMHQLSREVKSISDCVPLRAGVGAQRGNRVSASNPDN